MSRISKLIDYTRTAIDDIEKAISERMIATNKVPLGEYGNLIRSIKSETAEPLPLAIVMQSKMKSKPIHKFIVHDYTPLAFHLEDYEPIDLSTIAVTLELTEEDYTQEENLVEEEV